MAAATGIAAAPRSAEAATAPTRPRILIRGGYILTMDAALGDLRGDILIDNGKIAAIGKNLKASDAAIVDAGDAIVIAAEREGLTRFPRLPCDIAPIDFGARNRHVARTIFTRDCARRVERGITFLH